MDIPCSICTRNSSRNLKLFRPERCVVLDGAPCPACTEDIELENKIQELEILIEELHVKRRALRTAMNENHDQLIDKLPPEIVSQIFIQYSLPNSCSDITDLNSPLNLGAVCQKWRQLAWATPEIWSSLWFGFGSGRQRIGRLDLVPLVGEWLERSAGLPLTIKCAPGGEPADEIYYRLIDILNKYSTRWYDMDIAIPKRHRGSLCGSSEEQNILDRLTLRPHWRTDELQAHPSTDKSSTFRMKSKPSPTHFTLVSHSFAYIDISCNRLTHASVEDVHVDECCELIQCAPLLEVLKLRDIHGSHSRRRPPIPNSRVVLRHLHSLELNGNTKDKVLVRILDSISTPSLKHWIHRTYGESSPNMISFIEHSAFSLKTFQVAGPRDVYDELHLVLSHLSSLESLRLHIYSGFHEPDGPPPADEFLDLLCSPGEISVFLPHLQSLQFTGKPPFAWDSLSRIFTSSFRRSLIVKVDGQYDRSIPEEAIERLLELVGEGFNLSVVRYDGVDVLDKFRVERQSSQRSLQ